MLPWLIGGKKRANVNIKLNKLKKAAPTYKKGKENTRFVLFNTDTNNQT